MKIIRVMCSLVLLLACSCATKPAAIAPSAGSAMRYGTVVAGYGLVVGADGTVQLPKALAGLNIRSTTNSPSGTITAGHFVGNGSGLTGVSFGDTNWVNSTLVSSNAALSNAVSSAMTSAIVSSNAALSNAVSSAFNSTVANATNTAAQANFLNVGNANALGGVPLATINASIASATNGLTYVMILRSGNLFTNVLGSNAFLLARSLMQDGDRIIISGGAQHELGGLSASGIQLSNNLNISVGGYGDAVVHMSPTNMVTPQTTLMGILDGTNNSWNPGITILCDPRPDRGICFPYKDNHDCTHTGIAIIGDSDCTDGTLGTNSIWYQCYLRSTWDQAHSSGHNQIWDSGTIIADGPISPINPAGIRRNFDFGANGSVTIRGMTLIARNGGSSNYPSGTMNLDFTDSSPSTNNISDNIMSATTTNGGGVYNVKLGIGSSSTAEKQFATLTRNTMTASSLGPTNWNVYIKASTSLGATNYTDLEDNRMNLLRLTNDGTYAKSVVVTNGGPFSLARPVIAGSGVSNEVLNISVGSSFYRIYAP